MFEVESFGFDAGFRTTCGDKIDCASQVVNVDIVPRLQSFHRVVESSRDLAPQKPSTQKTASGWGPARKHATIPCHSIRGSVRLKQFSLIWKHVTEPNLVGGQMVAEQNALTQGNILFIKTTFRQISELIFTFLSTKPTELYLLMSPQPKPWHF